MRRFQVVSQAMPTRIAFESRHALGLAVVASIGGLAFANGGYFPVAWGWSALLLLWLAFLAVLVRTPADPGVLGKAFLGAVVALTAWTFASAIWSISVTKSIDEGERMLVYLATALAVLTLLRRSSQQIIVTGAWAAISLVGLYALATRLFPQHFGSFDPIAVYRLSTPVGYWNALGILAAMGVLLGLGLAARGSPAVRALAAASSVPLLLVLYFTFSRGAWIALFAGLVAALALDRRRLQLITVAVALAPWPALAIWFASRSDALTRQNSTLLAAARDGHGLAVLAIVFAIAAALTAIVLEYAEATVRVPTWLGRAYVVGLGCVVVAGALAVFARYGSPPTLVRKAYDAFNQPEPKGVTNLNSRLLNLSGNGRNDHWKVAYDEWRSHRLLGSGAGTYDVYWFQLRKADYPVQDAHSLYVETMAELGPFGLLLVVLLLAVPFAAVRRARAGPTSCVAFGAYVAFVLHAAVDWDWEMPVVTITGLFCALALIAAARKDGEDRPATWRIRAGGGALALGASAFVVVTLLGNSALSASSDALNAGNVKSAETEARRAGDFLPWSSAPWQRLGEAQARAGDQAAAQASFRQALRDDSSDWTLWFDLAQVSKGAEQRDALAAALRLDPRSPEVAAYEQSQRSSG